MDVFFHKIPEDSNTVIVKSAPIGKSEMTFNGKPGFTRTAASAKFGLLVICDEDGNTVDPRQYGFEFNQIIPGVRLSDSPVLDQETKEETGLYWAEPYDNSAEED